MAAIFSEVLGRKIEHVRLSRGDFKELLMKYGMDERMAEYMTELDVRVSKGEGKDPTGNVEAITEQPPRTFQDFVAYNETLWA